MAAPSAAWVESGCEARQLPGHSHENAALPRPVVKGAHGVGLMFQAQAAAPNRPHWPAGICHARKTKMPAMQKYRIYLALSAADAASPAGAPPAGAAAAAGSGRFEPCWLR